MDSGQKNYWKRGMGGRELKKLQLVGIHVGTEVIDIAAR